MKIEHGECECDEERRKKTIMMITLKMKLKAVEHLGEEKKICAHPNSYSGKSRPDEMNELFQKICDERERKLEKMERLLGTH